MPGTPRKLVYCCALHHSFAQNINFVFFTKVIFIQEAFKNMYSRTSVENPRTFQGFLTIFKDFSSKMLFQGFFKARANHEWTVKGSSFKLAAKKMLLFIVW